jgi:sterol desaturase/sphingolipid hydroxylase (fatty acid hydroxylase superfamily)
VVVFLFAVVVPFEKLFPRHPQRIRRPQVGTDIAHALLSTPLGAVTVAVGVAVALASFMWLPGLLLRPFVGMLPPLATTIVGLLLFDLVIYWSHRFGHEIPFLWRFHRVHHSTEHLDWISAFRSHPLDGAFLAPAFVFLVAAGFTPELAGGLVVVQLLVGLFLHANVRWRLRPLHKVVITPEFHHWHHANETAAHNANYSVFLPLWDLVFGTYYLPDDRRPLRYGVTPPVPAGVVPQLVHPLRGLRNPLRGMRHPVRALRELRRLVRRGLVQMRLTSRRTPWRTPWAAWRDPMAPRLAPPSAS